jgi:hypothetical protein
LIQSSDAIFVGVAKPIVSVNGKKPSREGLPVRLTEFVVHESLKGGFRPGERIQISQFESHSTPLQNGDLVLWYLKGLPNNKDGFVNPVGYFSGDFRRVSGGYGTEGVLLRNAVSNRGLWSNESDGALWNQTTFKKELAEKYLRARLLKHHPEFGDHPDALNARIDEALSFGDLPCKVQSLPLDFLLAATAARLESNSIR